MSGAVSLPAPPQSRQDDAHSPGTWRVGVVVGAADGGDYGAVEPAAAVGDGAGIQSAGAATAAGDAPSVWVLQWC